MPIYNVEKYIERALLSALNQTYQNLEILIVDDLGHDNSMDIVYQLKSTHPRGNLKPTSLTMSPPPFTMMY